MVLVISSAKNSLRIRKQNLSKVFGFIKEVFDTKSGNPVSNMHQNIYRKIS